VQSLVLGGKNTAEHCLEYLNRHMFTWDGGIGPRNLSVLWLDTSPST